jgi:hypothetical protein
MKIGDKVNYISEGQNKTSNISWKTSTHVYIKDENGIVNKIKKQYVVTVPDINTNMNKEEIKPSEKKGLISSFLSLFR